MSKRKFYVSIGESLNKQNSDLENFFYLQHALFATTFLVKANMLCSSVIDNSQYKVRYMREMIKLENINLFISIINFIFDKYTIIVKKGYISYYSYFFILSKEYMHLIQENGAYTVFFNFRITNYHHSSPNPNPELKKLLEECKINIKFKADINGISKLELSQMDICVILTHLEKEIPINEFAQELLTSKDLSSKSESEELKMKSALLFMLQTAQKNLDNINIVTRAESHPQKPATYDYTTGDKAEGKTKRRKRKKQPKKKKLETKKKIDFKKLRKHITQRLKPRFKFRRSKTRSKK